MSGGIFISLYMGADIYNLQMIYQISRDESESSCSECKKEHLEGESHAHHHDETSEDEEIIEIQRNSQALKPQKRGDSSNIVYVLQEQIRQLQKHNQEKDKIIRELKYDLDTRVKKTQLEEILARNSKSRQKVKIQPIMSPKGTINRIFSPDLRTKIKTHQQTDFPLQIVLLEKQIKEFQLKVMQLTNKLSEYQENISWMQKFIVSFVHMAEDLSLNYGGSMNLKGASLRKKTKMCWKYMKELINYLIK